MKKGDVVTIKDGSYTRSVVNGELIHESLAYGNEQNKQYVVIEIGCSFPLTCSWHHHDYRNDTVIQAVGSGKVILIHNRLLELVPPTHKVMVDIRQDSGCMYGQIVEISDELYKQIKK